MTTYTITNKELQFYVTQTFEHGLTTYQDVQHGPYKNEESAKRRIRDLKRKEAAEAANIAACDTPAINFETVEKLAASSITRQVGCYPAISKHAYQR